jgi:hypothetical protein
MTENDGTATEVLRRREVMRLDAAADGQFQPKLGDPGDVLTKRGGKGTVTYEGVTYTRLAWIRRIAAMGGTLHAGEGQVLVEELERVEEALTVAMEDKCNC